MNADHKEFAAISLLICRVICSFHVPGHTVCKIGVEFPGGSKTPESEWPALQDKMIDALIRLDAALRVPIQALNA